MLYSSATRRPCEGRNAIATASIRPSLASSRSSQDSGRKGAAPLRARRSGQLNDNPTTLFTSTEPRLTAADHSIAESNVTRPEVKQVNSMRSQLSDDTFYHWPMISKSFPTFVVSIRIGREVRNLIQPGSRKVQDEGSIHDRHLYRHELVVPRKQLGNRTSLNSENVVLFQSQIHIPLAPKPIRCTVKLNSTAAVIPVVRHQINDTIHPRSELLNQTPLSSVQVAADSQSQLFVHGPRSLTTDAFQRSSNAARFWRNAPVHRATGAGLLGPARQTVFAGRNGRDYTACGWRTAALVGSASEGNRPCGAKNANSEFELSFGIVPDTVKVHRFESTSFE